MQKLLKASRLLWVGILCGAWAVWISSCVIREMAGLLKLAGRVLGLSQDMLAYAEQVLSQLRHAVLVPAWIPVLLTSVLCSAVLLRINRRWLAACLWSLLLLGLATLSFWQMEINGIRFGAALSCVLPLLGQLL